jgi:hypothetical protein
MSYMRSWKGHRLTSHTYLGLNPQIGRPLSRIVGAIGFLNCKDFIILGISRIFRSQQIEYQPLAKL